MRLSVVIPVYNGGEKLRRCLEALAASSRLPDEVIVVDDGSTDGSGDLARQQGVQVIRLDRPARNAGYARNRGAEAARGDVLVFVDADVAVHPDTVARLEQVLAEHPEIAAVFGSYDDDPPTPGLAARYKNLLNHYVHPHGRREASTFWTRCGAIRREALNAVGWFSENVRTIEDIDLGGRLRRAGYRVWLCPDIQATHLKRWTLAGMLRSDIWDRAIPWAHIIARSRHLPTDLNLDVRSRLSAAAVWAMLAGLVAGFWAPWAWLGALLAGMVMVALNADLYRFFAKRGGVLFAAGAAGLYTLYLLYGSLVFVLIVGPAKVARHGLALVLLVTLLKGLVWSIAIPPWHAPDEQEHFIYGQRIERLKTLRVEPSLLVPDEAQQLFDLIQLKSVRHGGNSLDLTDRAGIADRIARLDDPATQWTMTPDEGQRLIRNLDFSTYHPPLYYAALAAIQWPLEGRSILIRLLACRWLSVVLGVATVAVAYRAGRELWPDRRGWALLLAILVSFQPMTTFSMAITGNGAPEIALFSACLLVSLVIIRQGLTARRGLALGLLIGLGLLVKISFLSIVPLVGLLVAWDLIRTRRKRTRETGGSRGGRHSLRSGAAPTWWPWLLVGLLPVLLSGWWYSTTTLSGGDTLSGALQTITDRPAVQLLPYLLHYSWLTTYRSVLDMYWGNFGWLDTPLPGSLMLLLSWLTVIATWTSGWWVIRQVVSPPKQARPGRAFAMLFLGCATLAIIAFYTSVDFRAAVVRGSRFGIQGRYYLPPIVGQMAWLAVGLIWPAPPRLRRVWAWLVGTGMVALNLWVLFRLTLPRYYGAVDLLTQLERATVLQPVSLAVLVVLCAAFVAAVPMLVVALGGALAPETDGGSNST